MPELSIQGNQRGKQSRNLTQLDESAPAEPRAQAVLVWRRQAAEGLSEVLWFREDLGWAEAGVRSRGIMETMRMRRA